MPARRPAPLDVVTRSRLSSVRGSGTEPELRLRAALTARGLAHRCNAADLPGRPDLAFDEARVAVFVDGCFWHRHARCYRAPSHNAAYWAEKVARNAARRRVVAAALREAGWRVVRAWECTIRSDSARVARRIHGVIEQRGPTPMAKAARIEIIGERKHLKASEAYLDVVFRYPDGAEWRGSVPYHYRRTGLFAETEEEKRAVVEAAYDAMNPSRRAAWAAEQEAFWGTSAADVTRAFFDVLATGGWKCVACQLPKNPNWARRVQDIKEMGYTLATDTGRRCARCDANTTHLLLLSLPRGGATGYETWSPALRKRILKVLDNFDAYECARRQHGLLPDHKFPEIRWDENTRVDNDNDMSDDDIRAKFQLLSNQRNQQKREVCRACFQTGLRGYPFGIPFYYAGKASWPDRVPARGKAAEAGCVGCGWHDLSRWREALKERLRVEGR